MPTTIILNFFAWLIALTITSSVALYDSRFDKVFAVTNLNGDTSQHDLSGATNHELHVGDEQTVSTPATLTRAHRRYTAHTRVRTYGTTGLR